MCQTKICKSCREVKCVNSFRTCNNTKDGYTSRCSICIKHNIYEILDANLKRCTKCDVVKDKSLFTKSNRTKDGKQPQCKECLYIKEKENKAKRVPHVKPDEGYKKCSKCNVDKHVNEFYLNPNLSMGVHSECILCTKNKVQNWQSENIDKVKNRERKKKPPKEKELKSPVFDKMCSYCKIIKPVDNFGKNTCRCKDCLKEYTKNRRCSITLTEKTCGKCKQIKPASDYNKDVNTVSGLSSKCSICRKEEYEIKKYNMMYKNKIRHQEQQKNDEFYRLVCTIRGRIRNSLNIYLKDNEKKSRHSEAILGCSWEEFKTHIESQFVSWMSWENFGDVCGDSPDYNCSWDLDHIIPVNWGSTNEELYMLNHWSNFQPLCSKVNRWEKKGNIQSLCNIELNITVYSKEDINLD